MRRALKYGASQHFIGVLVGISGKTGFGEGWRAGWQDGDEVTRLRSSARHGGSLRFGPPCTVASV